MIAVKKKFSTKWKKSKQPRKQKKYRHNAPMNIKGKFLRIHLQKDLAKRHGLRKIRPRTGDKVKVMRGKFKGKEGKIELVDLKKSKIIITGIEISKKDGSKSKPLLAASNMLLVDLVLDDKKRLKKKPGKPSVQSKTQAQVQMQKAEDKQDKADKLTK